ncbi:MAG: NAD(P)-dependent oxidoreductase [Spirochaetes bacterium]|nr:NAD(P)-dependent oxidoreductase [Spirochaetota bacterium]
MKKVLVTGGEGFVGFHLCKKLMEMGCEVSSIDINLAKDTTRRIPGVDYVTDSTENIQKVYAGRTFDMIYHLGEYSRVENSFKNIEQTGISNVKGTFEVFEFWRKQRCKILYAGSSTKFAQYSSDKETSPYAYTKARNTEMVEMYARWFDLKFATTYFYNVYGPKENETGDYATLIGIYKYKMRTKQNLAVVKPGTQKRNFTHVNDIVAGLVLVGEKGEGGDYGIGADDAYSVLEIAEMFGGTIEYLPERVGNRMTAELRSQNTKQLGWTPNELIKNYIEKLKANNFVD